MIIVTSNLVEQDWERVFGVHLLAETSVVIPWWVRKWGLNYYSPPSWLPTQEGEYGQPLDEFFHKIRICLEGQLWNETISDDLLLMRPNVVLDKEERVTGTNMNLEKILSSLGIFP
jgi:hypothetical protein